MRTSHRVASILLLIASAAAAQTASYQGKWSGHATASNGSEIRIDLTITESGGTLRTTPSKNYVTIDQCHDRDIPVVVQSQTASELTVAIQGGKVLRGCLDETATLTLIDPKTLQGTLKDGRSVKLTRK
jgi:hypothetical protein